MKNHSPIIIYYTPLPSLVKIVTFQKPFPLYEQSNTPITMNLITTNIIIYFPIIKKILVIFQYLNILDIQSRNQIIARF